MELSAAVAPQRTEYIARETGGMKPYHYGFVSCPFALHQSSMLQLIALLTENDELKFPMLGRKFYGIPFFNYGISFKRLFDKIPYGDYPDIEFISQFLKIVEPCHRTVVIHDLDKRSSGL